MNLHLRDRLFDRIEKSWYQDKWWNVWLLPLSGLFFLITYARRWWLQSVFPARKNSDIPVVIIGNINVGGTGKTPLTCRLVELLNHQSIKVGIISRGYGSNAPHYPYALAKGESANIVGDEPKLLRDRLQCPVVIGSDRNAAIALLLESNVDLILSDDGLQHYKMARDYELIVLDQQRQLGSGWLLPAGPLREGAGRLKQVDQIVYNGGDMHVTPTAWVNAKTGVRKALNFFANERVHAVVGIGNPQRFFNTLESLKVECREHIFVDHHKFQRRDVSISDDFSRTVVMTEKDWVKCIEFATESMWYLEVGAVLDVCLEKKLVSDLVALAASAD